MKGIVLKEMPLGEYDKLLTVFSPEQGRVSVVAKGAKKPGSRFLAAASGFAYSDMELVKGKSMYILRDAVIINSFYGLREDLDLLMTGADMAKITLKVIQEDLPDEETFSLLIKALDFLENRRRSPRLIKTVFLIKLMYVQGVIADFESATSGNGYGDRFLPGTKAAFDYICNAKEDKLFAFGVSDDVEAELSERSSYLCEHILL